MNDVKRRACQPWKSAALALLCPFLTLASASGQNLVLNDGFESGDFTDWTRSGALASTLVSTNAIYAHSGTYGAQLGPSGALGFLSQNMATAPGQTYVLSFWLDSPNGSTPNEFQVSWNGAVIFDQTNIGITGWVKLAFTNQATSTITPLQFGFQDNPSYLGLDEVIVTNVAPAPISSAAYTFTTFAGYTGSGSTDGVGGAAQFSFPEGITTDPAGNIYVVDSGNDAIRKVTPAGVVSTLAGLAGSTGTNDGLGNLARFGDLNYGNPTGIAIDNAGNLYVADTFNNTIRKLAPAGTNWLVSTIAGQPQFNFVGFPIGGTNDGVGTAILFNGPTCVAVDSATNLYVADRGNFTIRKLTRTGTNWTSSTIAGKIGQSGYTDGTGNAAQFAAPSGVALDAKGNVYVVDYYDVRKVAPVVVPNVSTNWVVTTLAGQGGSIGYVNAAGTNARFAVALNLALDPNTNIYVADTGNGLVRKVAQSGGVWNVTTLAGNPNGYGFADGTGTNASFNSPYALAVDSTGKIYETDSFNSEIRRITAAGVVTTLVGTPPAPGTNNGAGAAARFSQPGAVATDSAGNIYVADTFNDTIRVITTAGVVSTPVGLAGVPGSSDGAGNNARFNLPFGIAVDNSGNMYVADTFNNTIRLVTPDGVVSTISGLAGFAGTNNGPGTTARLDQPVAVAVDSQTNVFVLDSGNATVREVNRVVGGWTTSTIAGSPFATGTNDGAGMGALFGYYGHSAGRLLGDGALGITVDSADNIYVADSGNSLLRKLVHVGTNWVVSTIATSLLHVDSIATDAAGNIFAVDDGDTVLKITPFGISSTVSIIGGITGGIGSQDGTGPAARFSGPLGVAVDNAGTVYVADTQNNTIRKGVFTQYTAPNTTSYTHPLLTGKLQITLLPPEANGQWRFPWEVVWHNSGYTATNLATGNYPVEFRLLPNWVAIPASLTSTNPAVVAANATAQVTNYYFPTMATPETNGDGGSLTVNLGANPPVGAGWRFLGDSTPFFVSNFTTNLLPGTYLIEFAGPFPGRATPPNASVQVIAGLPTLLTAPYSAAAAPPSNILLPTPVAANTISDVVDYPFGFNGQLQTAVGFGSGVVVQPTVVLTAAHLVFDDNALTYVNGAYWFLQEEVPSYTPSPVPARGWYVLSGYAAQRSNDLSTITYGPDVSSPQSRNLDVAALYFQSPVANGGYGGYLPSDVVPNQWLTGTSEKMLVGYPVDGSEFGFTNIVSGMMYQIGPQPYSLSLSADSVTNQQEVYTASWFLSYPGNSGGPLYVQLNGYYYPAGIYLGTLNGQSVVRAIDSSVTNLITLAGTLGDSGTNNNGGGVITVVPNLAVSALNPGYLQIQLVPPSAVQAGAAWLLQPSTNYSTATNFTQVIFSTNAVALKFKPIPGWLLPTNQAVAVVPGIIAQPKAFYTVTNPVLQVTAQGLGLSGTTNTTYRIESTPSVNTIPWTGLSTNTIVSPGFNLVMPLPTNAGARFYRAVWLGK